jgi:hypothetical protein
VTHSKRSHPDTTAYKFPPFTDCFLPYVGHSTAVEKEERGFSHPALLHVYPSSITGATRTAEEGICSCD